jgi:dienelactone hydrolase
MGVAAVLVLLLSSAAAVPEAVGTPPKCNSATTAFEVKPQNGLIDTETCIVIRDLGNEAITLELVSKDSAGITWSSSTTYWPAGDGTIDLAKAAAQKPTPSKPPGYAGIDPMGPFDTLEPDRSRLAEGSLAYDWQGAKPRSFTLTVRLSNGDELHKRVIRRAAEKPGVTMTLLTVRSVGFYGRFYEPPPPRRKHAAVLLFGGSEGGLYGPIRIAARLLASRGYPSLALAYFGPTEPFGGLPPTLSEIKLEYFVSALKWLRARRSVDPKRIFVSGTSRGSEAALLLGIHYPELVHGVIANVPSSFVGCGINSNRKCNGKAPWTHGGVVPWGFTPYSEIEVERIKGPLFLDCGGEDKIWPSCQYSTRIEERLRSNADTDPLVPDPYPDGGHGLAVLVPYLPHAFPPEKAAQLMGRTPISNRIRVAELWPKLIKFLKDHS